VALESEAPDVSLVLTWIIAEVGGCIRPVADVYGQYLKPPHKNSATLEAPGPNKLEAKGFR
jgi:hypothetical protein